jgi:hypothetical protein
MPANGYGEHAVAAPNEHGSGSGADRRRPAGTRTAGDAQEPTLHAGLHAHRGKHPMPGTDHLTLGLGAQQHHQRRMHRTVQLNQAPDSRAGRSSPGGRRRTGWLAGCGDEVRDRIVEHPADVAVLLEQKVDVGVDGV